MIRSLSIDAEVVSAAGRSSRKMIVGLIMNKVSTVWQNGALSDSQRSCHLHNEQCSTNTIKENICSENTQTTTTAGHREKSPQKKT
jgi:hypothetical protein